MSSPPPLSVFALGKVTAEDAAALSARFPAVEVLAIDLPADIDLAGQQSLLRTAVNSAGHDWVLLMRGGEVADTELANEMAAALTPPPRAWGFRLKVTPTCGGEPLLLPVAFGGEIRLFHRRHVRFDLRNSRGEMNVEGAVVRLERGLRMEAFDSPRAHREWLAANASPQSPLRRVLVFSRNAIASGALWKSRATLRYLWAEAGWDRTSSRPTR